ncbi:MAG: transglycosylase SLT domain-containing protein [Parvularculaceae bacterium]
MTAATIFGAGPAGAMAPPRLKPPAPGPVFVAANDLERLKSVKETVGRRRFSTARAIVANIGDPTAKSLGQWYYLEAGDPDATLTEVGAFLDEHPDWPQAAKIQRNAERDMNAATPVSAILNFFHARDPITGEGKTQLARALFSDGENEAAELHLRDAWANDDFTVEGERQILSWYGGRLTAEDHAKRADRLLFERQPATARRVFSRLAGDEHRRDDVRAALLQNLKNAEALYHSLSPKDRADPGVIAAAIRYFRRKDEEPRAIQIALTAPRDAAALRDPGAFWYEQQLLMRWALKNRQYADAYAMAAHQALEPGSTEFAEAEFDAGWIALRYLGDAPRAEKHFAAMLANVGAPISLSRGWYWLARAAEDQGKADIARTRYAKAAEHIYTFYGQLAAEKIGDTSAKFDRGAPPGPDEKARFGSRPGVAALRMLTDVGDTRAFLLFSYAIDDSLESPGEFKELSDLAMRVNAPHVAVRAGKVAVKAGAFSPDVAYPSISVPPEAARFVPTEFILGLSRQESEFNPHAYSRAGARGVMQLIPSTALATARKERLPYRRSALLSDPNYNMIIGSAHLSHLIDRFGGSYIMSFAAYNAGVNRVAQWIEDYGDPRSQAIDPVDWIEQIPFSETRNYVQRVIENAEIYRSRISGGPIAGMLAGDIERGGPKGRVGKIEPQKYGGALPDLSPAIIAMAEPVINPVASAPEPAHADEASANAKQIEAAAAKSTPKPRRSFFGARRPARPKTSGPHGAPAPSPAPAETSSVEAKPATKISAPVTTALPEDQTLPDQEDAAPAGVAAAEPAPVLVPIAPDQDMAPSPRTTGEPAAAALPIAVNAGADNEAANTLAAEDADSDCIAYSRYIAETAKEEASAADLNAGALAEFQAGTKPCQ